MYLKRVFKKTRRVFLFHTKKSFSILYSVFSFFSRLQLTRIGSVRWGTRANALTHLRLTRMINHSAILLITRRQKGLTGRREKKHVRISAGVEGSARNTQNGIVSSANQDRWSIMAATGLLVGQPKSDLPLGRRACTGWFKPPPSLQPPPPLPPPTILLDRGWFWSKLWRARHIFIVARWITATGHFSVYYFNPAACLRAHFYALAWILCFILV